MIQKKGMTVNGTFMVNHLVGQSNLKGFHWSLK